MFIGATISVCEGGWLGYWKASCQKWYPGSMTLFECLNGRAVNIEHCSGERSLAVTGVCRRDYAWVDGMGSADG